MPIKRLLICLISIALIAVFASLAFASDWERIKGEHFIIYYPFKEDTGAASKILRKAEEYYDTIARDIGYSRYSNFWTWDERVKIIIFPNQKTFEERTGQPSWSRGYAKSDSELFKTRIIVSFRQEKGFLNGLLPHEISHLILRDFIGFDREIPQWFDEGIAQLYQKGRKKLSYQISKLKVRQKNYIPFPILFRMNIQKSKDPEVVKIFYSQSLTMVDFLIRRYGSAAFGILCRNLRDGENFEDALRGAYPYALQSNEEFQKKWERDLSR